MVKEKTKYLHVNKSIKFDVTNFVSNGKGTVTMFGHPLIAFLLCITFIIKVVFCNTLSHWFPWYLYVVGVWTG